VIKKVDLYLLKHFLVALVVVAIAIGATIMVINMIETISRFIDNEMPLIEIAEYYLYFAAWVLKNFLPMFVLLACLFSISMLARRNEILALKVSGRSLYRISLPLIVVAVLMSGLHFYYSEYIYPPLGKRIIEIQRFTIENRSKRSFTRTSNVTRQIRPGHIYTLASFDADRRWGADLRMFRSKKGELKQILTASRLIWLDHRWWAIDGVMRTFDGSRGETYQEFDTLLIEEIEDKPEDFIRLMGLPEDMGYDELGEYIELMKRTGGKYRRELIDRAIKCSYPLSTFIVVLISVPLAANPRRRGVAVSFATGVLISLVYFVLYRILQSAGYNEKLPVEISAWGVNALFFLVGSGLMFFARK
jgi:lipopolysaccharide export system permease protein